MKKKEEIKFEQPSEALLLANRYVMLVISIIVLALMTLGYFFLLKPKIEDIQSIEEQTTVSQEARRKNEDLLERIKKLKSEYDNIKANRQEDLSSLSNMIPKGTQIAELFVLADTLATDHNFRLDSIDIVDNKNIDNEEDTSFDPSTINQLTGEELIEEAEQEVEQTTINLKSLVVHLTLSKVIEEGGQSRVGRSSYITEEEETNTYQDFKNYLNSLENNLRLMDIQTVIFSELTKENGSFNLSIITYYR